MSQHGKQNLKKKTIKTKTTKKYDTLISCNTAVKKYLEQL